LQIADLGCARFLELDTLTDTLCGTRAYMAPEVQRGNYEFKCDIYSSGIVMYELITGKPAFNALATPSMREEFDVAHELRIRGYVLSDQCVDLMIKLLTANPNTRVDVKQALEHSFFSDYVEKLDELNFIIPEDEPIEVVEEEEEKQQELEPISAEELRRSITKRMEEHVATVVLEAEEEGEVVNLMLDRLYDEPVLLKSEDIYIRRTIFNDTPEVIVLVSNEEVQESKTAYVCVRVEGKDWSQWRTLISGAMTEFSMQNVGAGTVVEICLQTTLYQWWRNKTVRAQVQVYSRSL
jgi:serine/threonine protein kinase